MAIPVDTVWQVQADGADTNGGGFSDANKGATGTDMTLGAPTTFTSSLSGVGTTTLTDSGLGFLNTMLGNVINIAGQGFYCITAYLTSGTVTVDRALGTFSTTTGVVGGALTTLPIILGTTPVAVGGNTVYVKNGTYTLGATWTIGADGDVTGGPIYIVGYNTTRTRTNTDATQPLITSATNSVALITLNAANYLVFRNLKFTHTAATRGYGFTTVTAASAYIAIRHCTFDGLLCAAATPGVNITTSFAIIDCEIMNSTGANGGAFYNVGGGQSLWFIGNCVHDCAAAALRTTQTVANYIILNNIFDSNPYAIYDTATTRPQLYIIIGNTFYNSTNSHIDIDASGSGGYVSLYHFNNVYWLNGAYNVKLGRATADNDSRALFNNYNFYNAGTSGIYFNLSVGVNDVTLTGIPFVDAPNRNFALDNTASEGAACRNAAFPGTFPGGLSVGYSDAGAIGHPEPTIPAAADVRYNVARGYSGDAVGAIQMPNTSAPTGTEDATSDACVVSGKIYGSTPRTGSAAGGGGGRPELRGANL